MSDSLRFLKKVWIGGQVESVYLDDTLLLSLMMKNPTVDTFVDAQAFGLSHWVGHFLAIEIAIYV